MRLLLSSVHTYPAFGDAGSGLHPRLFPSGSGFHIHDLLAKGLAELGHDVFYLLPNGADKALPHGVTLVSELRYDADILHTISTQDHDFVQQMQSRRRHWVTTCHLDLKVRGKERSQITESWIFVSRTLAQSHGSSRYVLNGLDPSDYIYSETKDDYFLFMSAMDWGIEKGLDVALSLSRQIGFKLIIAGTGSDHEIINRVDGMCQQGGAKYVGDVKGREKAELLAGAKAFLFPTKLDEAFGLGMVEALFSGTPVICSDKGACPEIISSEVGFVCAEEKGYVAAIDRLADISPQACREKALREYHYLRMATDYVAEYQKEIARNGN
jgi:glycosyltransferase involved in cell wall biosynthesis